MAEFHTLTVTAAEPEGGDAVCLTFDVPPGLAETFRFTPGQYLTLRADLDGQDLRRPYSICSAPGAPLQVGVRHVADGRFSPWACGLKPGDRIEVMPPEGRFVAETGGPHRYLLIAAGSGITPMMSIAEAVLDGHPEAEITLVYGNRETASIMFLTRLSDLKDRCLGRFQAIHILSREPQDVDLLHGRIDAKRLRALTDAGLIDPVGADGIFLCGPGTMTDMAEMELGMMGVSRDRVHFERFIPADGALVRPPSAKAEAATGATVETILDGQRRVYTHESAGDSVLDAAREHGIDLPFSCAGGMCCTCRCRIVEGTAEMAVNYSLEPWEIEAGFTLACQARPTADRLVLDFDAV
ncbi:MAG: 2Fe-2S iron-sulfur cluster-binding protein [Pseudomonadota bacterium]